MRSAIHLVGIPAFGFIERVVDSSFYCRAVFLGFDNLSNVNNRFERRTIWHGLVVACASRDDGLLGGNLEIKERQRGLNFKDPF